MSDKLIPENFQDVESLDKLLEIYFSSTADSDEIVKDPLKVLSTDFLIKKTNDTLNVNYDKIKEELFKIHLQEIFKTFEEVESNEDIYNKFKILYAALGISDDELKIAANIDEKINEEYINAAKSFKTKKGTKAGFFFVYDIINKAGIQALNNDAIFDIIEGTDDNPNQPYQYTIKTTLYKEVVKETLIPLAHPLGFEWHFIRLLFLYLEDYFGLNQIKTIKDIVITCYYGNDINQTPVIDSTFGAVRDFTIDTDQDQNEKVVIDFEPLNPYPGILPSKQNGLRLIRDYNGRITLFNKQRKQIVEEAPYNGSTKYLEISELRLAETNTGLLDIFKSGILDVYKDDEDVDLDGITDYTYVTEARFREYTIIDRDYVDLEYQIVGDLPDKWYRTRIPLQNKSVSENKKLFEAVHINRDDIFDNSFDYDGTVEKDYGNCLLTYGTEYAYEVTTSDISTYVTEVRNHLKHLPLDSRDPLYQVDADGNPYTGPRNTLDNTVQEIDEKVTFDYWARLSAFALDPRKFFYVGMGTVDEDGNPVDEEPLIGADPDIDGGTYDIGDENSPYINPLNEMDKGWNSLRDNNNELIVGYTPGQGRNEPWFAPDAWKDLQDLGSRNTVERYIKDNEHNSEYSAKEDMYENQYINFFKSSDPRYDNTADNYINTDLLITPNYSNWFENFENQLTAYNYDAGILSTEEIEADPVNMQYHTTEYYAVAYLWDPSDTFPDAGDVDPNGILSTQRSDNEVDDFQEDHTTEDPTLTTMYINTDETHFVDYNSLNDLDIGETWELGDPDDSVYPSPIYHWVGGEHVYENWTGEFYRLVWNTTDDDLENNFDRIELTVTSPTITENYYTLTEDKTSVDLKTINEAMTETGLGDEAELDGFFLDDDMVYLGNVVETLDYFGCGVYRGTELLLDNNVSSYNAA